MTSKKILRFLPIIVLILGPAWSQVHAQDEVAAVPEGTLIPVDDFNRGTPHRSIEGFLLAADKADYETAAEYLDLRNLRGEANSLNGPQLARRLAVIMARADWIDVDEPVDDPVGASNDGLPAYRDSLGVVRDADREVRLLMQRVPRGDGVSIWKVSNATVSRIPALYDAYGYPGAIERLRVALPNVSVLGFELFKWVILLVVAAVVYAAVFLIALLTQRTFEFRDPHTRRQVFRFLVLPFAFSLIIILVHAAANTLGTGPTMDRYGQLSPVPALVITWLLLTAVNLLRDIYSQRLDEIGRPGAVALLRTATNAVKILLGVLISLAYLHKIGVNIATVVAGLGVGSIAVALALQKPLEDVFGAITLYMQQPIRVGDLCRIGDETGTIEEINLRATRIRTLKDTLIAVPNARLANEPIDNISARQMIRYRSILRLRSDTPPDTIRQALEGIRELLELHDQVLDTSRRVRFSEISDDALLIEVNCYLDTTVWAEYLELAEELNLRILELLADAGTSLAPPTSTVRVEQGDGATLTGND